MPPTSFRKTFDIADSISFGRLFIVNPGIMLFGCLVMMIFLGKLEPIAEVSVVLHQYLAKYN